MWKSFPRKKLGDAYCSFCGQILSFSFSENTFAHRQNNSSYNITKININFNYLTIPNNVYYELK